MESPVCGCVGVSVCVCVCVCGRVRVSFSSFYFRYSSLFSLRSWAMLCHSGAILSGTIWQRRFPPTPVLLGGWGGERG